MTLRAELKNLVRFWSPSHTKRTSAGYRKGGGIPPFAYRGRFLILMRFIDREFLILMIFIDPTKGLKKTCKLVEEGVPSVRSGPS